MHERCVCVCEETLAECAGVSDYWRRKAHCFLPLPSGVGSVTVCFGTNVYWECVSVRVRVLVCVCRRRASQAQTRPAQNRTMTSPDSVPVTLCSPD